MCLFLSASLVLMVSCGGSDDDDDNTACLGGLFCNNFGTEITTCCSSSQCSYETNGQTFFCDGTTCDFVGAPELANYCLNDAGPEDLAKALLMEKARNKTLNLLLDQAHEDILN